MLPACVSGELRAHLSKVSVLHAQDLAAGFGRALLPDALARKHPNADRQWGWQWIFPASKLSVDPRSGVRRRHHLHESVLQRAIHVAARVAGIEKPVGPHTLRHYAESRIMPSRGGTFLRACMPEAESKLPRAA